MKAIITAALVSFVVAVTCAGASISTLRGGGTPYPIQTRGYQVKLAILRARMTKLETREGSRVLSRRSTTRYVDGIWGRHDLRSP